MANFANGQCSHRYIYGRRCIELATETREWRITSVSAYDVGLCTGHAREHDSILPVGR